MTWTNERETSHSLLARGRREREQRTREDGMWGKKKPEIAIVGSTYLLLWFRFITMDGLECFFFLHFKLLSIHSNGKKKTRCPADNGLDSNVDLLCVLFNMRKKKKEKKLEESESVYSLAHPFLHVCVYGGRENEQVNLRCERGRERMKRGGRERMRRERERENEHLLHLLTQVFTRGVILISTPFLSILFLHLSLSFLANFSSSFFHHLCHAFEHVHIKCLNEGETGYRKKERERETTVSVTGRVMSGTFGSV